MLLFICQKPKCLEKSFPENGITCHNMAEKTAWQIIHFCMTEIKLKKVKLKRQI